MTQHALIGACGTGCLATLVSPKRFPIASMQHTSLLPLVPVLSGDSERVFRPCTLRHRHHFAVPLLAHDEALV